MSFFVVFCCLISYWHCWFYVSHCNCELQKLMNAFVEGNGQILNMNLEMFDLLVEVEALMGKMLSLG